MTDVLPELNRPQPWMADGVCRDYPTSMFFPRGEGRSARSGGRDEGVLSSEVRQQVQKAKAICSGCAVRVECLTYAVEQNEPDGIWGGRTTAERRRLRRRLAAASRTPTEALAR